MDKLKYSSPQAYLNRHFRSKSKKFVYTLWEGLDIYENQDYMLIWERNEIFTLMEKMRDNATGARYSLDIAQDELINLVELLKRRYKNERK